MGKSHLIMTLALAILAVHSAYGAGYWNITYQADGTYTAGWDGPYPWENPPTPNTSGTLVFTVPGINTAGTSGTIATTLHWVPDPNLQDPPPADVTVGIEVSASGNDMLWATCDTDVSDGFEDPMVPDAGGHGGASSRGLHFMKLPVPPSGEVALPPIHMAAHIKRTNIADPTTVVATCTYRVLFGDVSVKAWSTDRPAGNLYGFTPGFFSGTGCFAEGEAHLACGIAHATLDVNGEIIAEKVNPGYLAYTDPYPVYSHQAGYFQSNHWPNDTLLVVRYTVIDANGIAHVASVSARAVNKVLDLANTTDIKFRRRDYGQRINDTVAKYYRQMNYDVTPSCELDAAHILQELPRYTAFSIGTHGGADYFLDCVHSEGTGNPSVDVDSMDTRTSVKTKILWGQGPGYKYPLDSLEPPYNLVTLFACDTLSGGDLFATAFFTYKPNTDRTDDMLAPEDRALVGWNRYVFVGFLPDFVDGFFAALNDGYTVTEAASCASSISRYDGIPAPVILGDPTTTLNAAYHGFGWRRPTANE